MVLASRLWLDFSSVAGTPQFATFIAIERLNLDNINSELENAIVLLNDGVGEENHRIH